MYININQELNRSLKWLWTGWHVYEDIFSIWSDALRDAHMSAI